MVELLYIFWNAFFMWARVKTENTDQAGPEEI